MEQMEHQNSGDEETQDVVRPRLEIEQGHGREMKGDSHGLGASAPQQTSYLGGGVTIE